MISQAAIDRTTLNLSKTFGRFWNTPTGIIKPLHILWNEMSGFVFICIAIIATPRVMLRIVVKVAEFPVAPNEG